jgi:hypothetical protein
MYDLPANGILQLPASAKPYRLAIPSILPSHHEVKSCLGYSFHAMESHRIRPMPPGISLISFIGAETSGIYFRYQKIDIVIQKPFTGKKEDRR